VPVITWVVRAECDVPGGTDIKGLTVVRGCKQARW